MSKKLLTSLGLALFLFTFALSVSAVSTPLTTDSATLNGNLTATVTPSSLITIIATSTVGNVASSRWHGTAWAISTTSSSSMNCFDNTDHNAIGFYSESFTASAPVTPGTYNVYIQANSGNSCDATGGSLLTMTDALIVIATSSPDTEAPVITLLGSNPVDITVGDIYVDAGATATDAIDGSVPVVVTGTVDILAVGTYTLLYTATDTAANIATTTRTVNVKAKAITEATSTPSHRGGSSIVNVNFAFASTTGQVLGTSTEKTLGKTFRAPLTPEQKRLRLLRRHLNRIKIAAYDLRHPQLQTNSGVEVLGTSTQSSNSVPLVPSNLTVTDSGEIVSTSTKATTTPKKPFWKLW